MANKFSRDMDMAVQSQEATEVLTANKYAEAAKLVQSPQIIYVGRTSPQICCTITPEDKALLDILLAHACEKKGRPVKQSVLMRSMIRLCSKYKDKLEL